MAGVVALVIVIVFALALTGAAAARGGMRARWRSAAERRVGDALRSEDAAERQRRVAELAASVAEARAGPATALVFACRQAFSREVAPVLVALLQHPDAEVGADARRALTDQGAPALRAVWTAYNRSAEAGPARDRLGEMLSAHPDWLFERLIDDFVAEGAPSVRRLTELWGHPGMRDRLEWMGAHSDAVAAIRAREIQALSPSGAGSEGRAPAGAHAG